MDGIYLRLFSGLESDWDEVEESYRKEIEMMDVRRMISRVGRLSSSLDSLRFGVWIVIVEKKWIFSWFGVEILL